jgi:hypothetical protein
MASPRLRLTASGTARPERFTQPGFAASRSTRHFGSTSKRSGPRDRVKTTGGGASPSSGVNTTRPRASPMRSTGSRLACTFRPSLCSNVMIAAKPMADFDWA